MVTGNFSASKNQNDHSYLRELKEVATKDDQSCLQLLDSQINGLSSQQIIDRREKFGFNEIASEKAPAWYKQLLLAFII